MDNNNKKKTKKKPSGGEHQKNWREVYASVTDIQQFLDGRIMLRRNALTGLVESRWPGQFPGETYPWEPLSSVTVNTLWAELSHQKPVRKQDMQNVIESQYVAEYHPFRFYLERLPPWDGKSDAILAMSVSVQVKGGTDEQMLFAEYLKKWLVWMVAAWVDPQVVNNVILVLIGAQGTYKTTWFSRLLPPELREYFLTKTNATRMDKDDRLKLSQYGLVCCEELDTMSGKELNQLKAAVTMVTIDERIPYERYPRHLPHVASFCGTGNNVEFLADPTGNRRWLPFEVECIDPPQDFPFDYEAIYSQAYGLYKRGFRYWFSQDEIQRLSRHNERYEVPKMEQELVDQYFRRPAPHEQGEFMPVSRAMQIIGGVVTTKLSDRKLGRAFQDLGFEFRRTSTSRGYIVVQRSGLEIKEKMQRDARDVSDVSDVMTT